MENDYQQTELHSAAEYIAKETEAYHNPINDKVPTASDYAKYMSEDNDISNSEKVSKRRRWNDDWCVRFYHKHICLK